MNIEKALRTRLTDELSAQISARCYPDHLPQSPTYPAIAYRRSTVDPISKLSDDNGMTRAGFDVAVFSKSFDECVTVTDLVQAALQRYSGTVETIDIVDISIDNLDEDYEPDWEVWQRTLDITIWYRI